MNEAQLSLPTATPGFEAKSFWQSTARYARAMSRAILVPAFTLYYTLEDSKTPLWAKATIGAALAYLVFPVDAIPDFIPAAGYSDDWATLGAAGLIVATHITAEHRGKARQQTDLLLGTSGS